MNDGMGIKIMSFMSNVSLVTKRKILQIRENRKITRECMPLKLESSMLKLWISLMGYIITKYHCINKLLKYQKNDRYLFFIWLKYKALILKENMFLVHQIIYDL